MLIVDDEFADTPLMPWDSIHYPPAMAHLPNPIREKAIEIANALLGEGYEEGMCIRIAISKAKQWGQAHGLIDLT